MSTKPWNRRDFDEETNPFEVSFKNEPWTGDDSDKIDTILTSFLPSNLPKQSPPPPLLSASSSSRRVFLPPFSSAFLSSRFPDRTISLVTSSASDDTMEIGPPRGPPHPATTTLPSFNELKQKYSNMLELPTHAGTPETAHSSHLTPFDDGSHFMDERSDHLSDTYQATIGNGTFRTPAKHDYASSNIDDGTSHRGGHQDGYLWQRFLDATHGRNKGSPTVLESWGNTVKRRHNLEDDSGPGLKLPQRLSKRLRVTRDLQPEQPSEDTIEPTMLQISLSEQRTTGAQIARKLEHLLNDTALCRVLLQARGPEAQVLLDVFQWLLDERRLDDDFRRRLIVATQRLSTRSSLYPICYELKGIAQDGQEPVTGGGFADIYKGVFKGQVVCLKTIRVYQQSQLEHVLKQFSKEVILWGQLSHPNVLPIYGLYHFKNRLCIVTPWMQNGDITRYLQHNAKVDRLFLVFDIAKGLQYLHDNHIVHGDLKGPNILIDDDGRARLCDFGIASVCDPEIQGWTTQSSLSSMGGSARWQAPELFDIDDGDIQNSTFSDMYAFGCVLYEVYTGKVPFYEILRDTAVMYQVQRSKRPSKPGNSDVSWQEWGLTESIWLLMEDCWKAAINGRPTAQQAVDRLSSFLQQDARTTTKSSVLPATHFRRSMSNPPDVTCMASVARICDAITGGSSSMA